MGVPREYGFSRRDLLVVAAVIGLCFSIFRHAPRRQSGGDSRYSILLSDNLARHRDFALERYDLPRPDYRLEDVGGHRYYLFPVGTAILSVPYVAVMRLRGVSAIHADGSYDFQREETLDAHLAAILMAAFSGVVFLTARLLLSTPWALVVTFVSAFGTQVFSTTSRGLWSDTWGVLLTGLAGFLLLRSAALRREPCLPVLATIEAWAYIVRPTSSLTLVGTALYLAFTMRRSPWRFLATAGAWLGLFVMYSWRHFHRLLPDYYAAGRLGFDDVGPALLGNLVSPSRGLLVCVPLVIAVALLLVRYRATLRFRVLLTLLFSLMAGHLLVLSGFGHWWGGHCFGARLTASLVPWIVISEILAVDAWRQARARGEPHATRPVLWALAGVLSMLSVAINAVGAFSLEAQKWNVSPDIDQTPWRLWSWRRPQFLAPLIGTDPTEAAAVAPGVSPTLR